MAGLRARARRGRPRRRLGDGPGGPGSTSLLEGALNSAAPLQCADKPIPAKLGPEAWPEVTTQLTGVSYSNGPVLGWWLWAPCAAMKITTVNRYAGPWNAVTPNPVLVIGTRFDPRTTYKSSVLAARTLGNAVLLTHDGYGHTSDEDPSTCSSATWPPTSPGW